MSKLAEIELTYLARELPKALLDVIPQRLTDRYIPDNSTFSVLRLRRKDYEYELTKKVPVKKGDYSSHTEHTIPIDTDEFEVLKKTSNRIVDKNRFTIIIDAYSAEVDVFLGELAGLVLIDFEFTSEAEKNRFRPPHFCLADVTQEQFVLGGQLAGKSYEDIKDDLQRFSYVCEE